MTERPSEILTRAADLIRDTAAATGDETSRHWEQGSSRFQPHGEPTALQQDAIWDGHGTCLTGGLADEDARWIALLNPAVAEPLERWLRWAACAYELPERRDQQDVHALSFARHVLGLENTPEETQ